MKIHLIQIKINELLAVCDEHNNDPGELINILHAAQGIFGYLPREVQEIIASRSLTRFPGYTGLLRSIRLLP